MAISLNKGGNLSLSKSEPGLVKISVGLGWAARATAGADFDLDASCFLLGASGKMRSDDDFIFYNQLQTPDGSVVHQGDNLTGAGDGDDEVVMVDLNRVAPDVMKLVFTVTIHEAEARRQNFGQVGQAFIRVANTETGNEIVRYDLSEDASTETAMIFGELYRHNGEWKFRAVGQGFAGGLGALLKNFGGEESSSPTPAPPVQPPLPPVQPPLPPVNQPPLPPLPPILQPSVHMPPPPVNVQPPPPPPVQPPHPSLSLNKVTLEKRGEKTAISLTKGGGEQLVRVNLNWNAPPPKRGLFGTTKPAEAPDLDLGCMYRLKSGEMGVVQPLGNRFGSRNDPPYIFLDKDDRSGAAADGENLTIFRPDQIDLVMVFAMIYGGAADFTSVGGRLTLKEPSGREILVNLSSPEHGRDFCAVATIRASGGHIEITKEELYFPGHREADAHFGFGFRWVAGSK
ncbi:general stress protein 16U [Abditibacteriota bacterium]|nr:general stress protein 16U [Abditibacteriota bacterium]